MLRGLRSRRGSITFNGALHLSTHLSTHRSRDNIRPPSKFSSVPGRAVEPDQRTCDHPTKHLREALSILRAHANSIASRRSPSVAADSFKDKPEPEHVISSRVQQDDEIVSGRIHSERISGILSKKDISDDDVIQVLRSIQSELNEIARSKGITPPLVKTSELPRSPLLDPVLVEARMRYHVTKGRPDNERTDFEARVSSNLYG